MNPVRIPFPEEGNPNYPLPHDYAELDSEGQRLARVNACKQYRIFRSDDFRQLRARAYVAALHFFDAYYLQPVVSQDGETLFDPYFYKDWSPAPPWHDLLYASSVLNKYTAGVAPRGNAKTSALQKSSIFSMLTSPNHEILYATSTHDLAHAVADTCRYQCYYNSRINDDFGCDGDFGGSPSSRVSMKPGRSEGSTGVESFALSNRSLLTTSSAQARQRGKRPVEYKFDDPEYDPKGETSLVLLRDYMESFVFKVILPMVQAPSASLSWWGTFISKRHYLWEAMETETRIVDGKPVTSAKDPRYDGWYRLVIPMEGFDEKTGKRISAWPHRHPIDDAERISLGLSDRVRTCDQIRRDVGDAVYNAEYLNKPGDSDTAHFPPLVRERHGYWIEDADPNVLTSPLRSRATICWHRKKDGQTVTHRLMLSDFLSKYRPFITLDTSWTHNTSSDFKVAACMCLTELNELFVLDLWSAQCPQARLVVESLLMADRFRASIHPEKVGAGIDLEQDLLDKCKLRATEVAGTQFVPPVKGFSPGFTEKGTRIDASLKYRFDHDLIKLPFHRFTEAPFVRLTNQIKGFNPLAKDCGLQHDDELDAVAMHTRVVGGRSVLHLNPDPLPQDAFSRLKRGEKIDPKTGMPIALDFLMTGTPDQLYELIHPDPSKVENGPSFTRI